MGFAVIYVELLRINMIKLSIIIVNYNTKVLTSSCIESIYNHKPKCEFEIVVVDNNSTDGSQDILKSDKRIKFIESGANLGFGKANSIGYQNSGGEILLFLNSDTIIENDILNKIVSFIDNSDPNIGCVGTILQDINHNDCTSFGYDICWINEFLPQRYTKPISFSNYINEVDFVSGANLCIKRVHIEKFGLFSPVFFMYYEDAELGFRYRKFGLKCVILNERGIIHLEGSSSNKMSAWKIRVMTQSYLSYLKLTLNYKEYVFARCLIALRRTFTCLKYKWNFYDLVDYIKILYTA